MRIARRLGSLVSFLVLLFAVLVLPHPSARAFDVVLNAQG